MGIVAAVLFAMLVPAPAQVAAALSSPFAVDNRQPLAPGVEYRRGTVSGAGGGAAVNVVSARLSESIGLYTTLAFDRINAREAPTAQAARHSREGHRIVATINGSNFSAPAGVPYQANGLLITGGELTSAGFRRSGDQLIALGVDGDGRALVGAPRVSISATLPDGTTAPIARVNQRPQADDSVLFSPRYDTSTRTSAPTVEVVISGVELPLRPRGSYSGTVSEVRLGTGDAPLAAGTLVISATGSAAAPFTGLQVGDPLTVAVAIDAPWQDVVTAVGGREQLVRNGAIDIFPTNGRKFSDAHPRSAVGVTADGEILIVAVDGRQAHTRGLTIPETAELMLDLGAVDAINLDGGGSTVLSARAPGNIEATIANSPSGGVERTVSNALHVVSTIPTGQLAEVAIVPAQATLKAGHSLQLTLGGHDVAYNGLIPDVGPVSWAASGDAASIDSSGLLTGLKPGTTTVTAVAGEWSAEARLDVVPDLGELTVTPPEAAFVPGITAGTNGLWVDVSWQAGNPKAAVTGIELQARVNGGSWTSVSLPQAASTSVRRWLRFGRRHQLRVRASDALGSRSAWVYGTPFRLVAYELTDPLVERVGAWQTVPSTSAIGGSLARSHAAGASLSLAAAAEHVAVIGQRSARGGTAAIGIDGGAAASVSMYARSTRPRVVLWVGGEAPEGEDDILGTVRVSNTSAAKRPRVDIDAVVVLRLDP